MERTTKQGGHEASGPWRQALDCRARRIAAGDGNTADPTILRCQSAPHHLQHAHGLSRASRVGPRARSSLLPALALLLACIVAAPAAALDPLVLASDLSVTEGDEIDFEVRLSTSSNRLVTVQYATESGADRFRANANAESGRDFTAVSGTLSFAPGETSKTVRVSTTSDLSYEFDEKFYLRLSNPTNARLDHFSARRGYSRATGTIVDDDPPPTVSISDGSATEGDKVEFKISLSAPTGRSVYVDLTYEVGPGDTASLFDFDSRQTELGFAGVGPFTVRATTTDDDIDEEDETFTVRLSNPRGVTLGDATATGTIIDDDDETPIPPPPSDSPTVGFWLDPHAVEGDWMRFFVRLSKPSDRKVSVQYRISSVTARSGEDFSSGDAAGLLVFQPGDTFETIDVATMRDTDPDEGSETFTMTLSSPTNAMLGDATATGTITEADTDADGSPFVAVTASTRAVEGTPVTFTVRLSAPSEQTVTVQYLARGTQCFHGHSCGSAKSGVDYVATSGTLTFAPNQTEKTVSVSTTDDSEYEATESFYLKLSNPTNAVFRTLRSSRPTRHVTAEILDNDEDLIPVASFALQVSSAQEDSGTHDVTITLSPAPTFPITLKYRIGTGTTANYYSDYRLPYGGVSVPSGATTATIPVTIIDDEVDDSGETIILELVENTRYLAGYKVGASSRHTLTIQDELPPTPLTASLERVPSEHDGAKSFSFDVRFSEALGADGVAPVASSFAVSRGKVKRVEQAEAGMWRVRVKPTSWRDVTVTLAGGRACAEKGAVCTQDGRALSNAPSATIGGPVRIRVEGARGREGRDATLDFAVRLNRVAMQAVSVDYSTIDGTATAGEDYTATSGTLTFAPGETEKTVTVPILDDAIDEGKEKFTVRLSNPQGAYLRKKHRDATGVIVNEDPLPEMWLSRFGRTAAGHTMDAVAERLNADGPAAAQATIAGHLLSPSSDALLPNRGWAALHDGQAGEEPRTMQLHELLASSSFHLAAAPEDAYIAADGRWSLWGRGAWSQFEGTEDDLKLDGRVLTATAGADYEQDRLLAGMAVSYSSGSGTYDQPSTGESGKLGTALLGVHPYVRLTLHERLAVWGLFGYAVHGELTLDRDGADAIDTGTGLVMGAFGVRSTLVQAAHNGGFELAARTDGLLLRVRSEEAEGLAASAAEVQRLRLLLNASYAGLPLGGGVLTPALEVGGRYDRGDAETGAGLVVGGSLAYTLPAWGLSLAGSGRALLVHEHDGFREWSAGGSLRLDPGTPGRGLALSVQPSWGTATAASGEHLWSLPDAPAQAENAGSTPNARLAAELSYGTDTFGGAGLLTPYAGLALAGNGERIWKLGSRLRVDPGLSLGLQATRTEPAGTAPDHAVTISGSLHGE